MGNWFTFLLWLVSTIAIAVRLVQQPAEDKNDDDAEDSDDEDDIVEHGGVLPPENFDFDAANGQLRQRQVAAQTAAAANTEDDMNVDQHLIRPPVPML